MNNNIEILVKQTRDAYAWIDKLINKIPQAKWDDVPEIVGTNVTWQAGHLVVSLYFHSIMVVVGHQPDLLQTLPMRMYSGLFTKGDPKQAAGKVKAAELRSHLTIMQNRSLGVIGSLLDNDLEAPLKAVEISHPVAKTKFEAIDWNIKHTMWHCGQLGILMRVLGERYDFGLKMG